MTRVTFIGAGSIEFTRNVVTDLCTSPGLRDELEFALHDIGPDRLRFAGSLVQRIVDASGSTAKVTLHTERTAALEGASYVINEIQVGGYDATRIDFDVPARFGLRQTIGDTLGIGGIFRGLRTIPVVVGIARDMIDVCPDAFLLNYTNPMAMLPWAVYRATGLERVFGLCHSVRDTHWHLSELVGVDHGDIDFLTAGFNHQAFVLKFERAGQSLYPRLREVLDAAPDMARRVRVEIFRRFGYFPTESSEHSAEYVPWFMRHDSEVERFRIFVGDYLTRSEENLLEYEALQRQLAGDDPLDLQPTHELASQFIHSLETGEEQEIYVNVRNGSLITSLPAECCVEVPCLVGGPTGPQPVAVGDLPPQLAALNRTFLNVVELTVAAALTGDRQYVYQAALLDPNAGATLTTSDTVTLCDAMLEAHASVLPAGLRT
jgi:alpha-galactosidase